MAASAILGLLKKYVASKMGSLLSGGGGAGGGQVGPSNSILNSQDNAPALNMPALPPAQQQAKPLIQMQQPQQQPTPRLQQVQQQPVSNFGIIPQTTENIVLGQKRPEKQYWSSQ